MRYDMLEKAKNSDRFKEVINEYEFLLSLKEHATKLQNLLNDGRLPIRVVHNDTKCSNVLFDKDSLNFISVIDLDTVMPGIIAFDYGDGARSICSVQSEESCDFNKIEFSLLKFDYFSNGFLTQLKDQLCSLEKEYMYLGVFTLTCELAIRFLTDYLMNDCYFKINYPENNKMRALNQICLLKDVINKEEYIKKIANKYLY